jgi:capsid protein
MTHVIKPSLTTSLYLAILQYAVCSKALTCPSQQAVATTTSIAVDEPGSQRSALSSACDL